MIALLAGPLVLIGIAVACWFLGRWTGGGE